MHGFNYLITGFILTFFAFQERRLHMYVKYCQNKPLSEYLVHRYKTPYFTEIQSELKTKLDIADYLIKPVQRVMKYQLLLKVKFFLCLAFLHDPSDFVFF